MPHGIASSNQLSMMDKVLSAYCSTHNVIDPKERDDAASLVLHLFDAGYRDEETLLAEMIRRRSVAAQ